MIGLTKIINPKIDDLKTLIDKVSMQRSISTRTENSLVKVANSSCDMGTQSLNFIFKGTPLSTHEKVNECRVSKLINDLERCQAYKNGSVLKPKIQLWVDRARELQNQYDKIKGQDEKQPAPRSDIIFFPTRSANTNHSELVREVNNLNAYYANHGYEQPMAKIINNSLAVQSIKGTRLDNRSETQEAVKELFEQGFLMTNAQPINFVRTVDGKLRAVNFDFVFNINDNDLKSIAHATKIKMVEDYYNGGVLYLPDISEIKSTYQSFIQKVEKDLGKDNPVQTMYAGIRKQAEKTQDSTDKIIKSYFSKATDTPNVSETNKLHLKSNTFFDSSPPESETNKLHLKSNTVFNSSPPESETNKLHLKSNTVFDSSPPENETNKLHLKSNTFFDSKP